MNQKVRATGLDRFTLFVGVLTIAYTVFLGTLFPTDAVLSEGFNTPIIAFEFAKTAEDIAFLAGNEEPAVTHRAKMDAGNGYDMAYPFLYGGLLALLMLRLARNGQPLAWVGFAFALAIIPADINENLVLLEITKSMAQGGNGADLLAGLHVATWAKWGAIAAVQFVAALCLLGHKIWLGGALAAVGTVILGSTWFTGADPVFAELAGPGLGLLLLYVTLRAARDAFRK